MEITIVIDLNPLFNIYKNSIFVYIDIMILLILGTSSAGKTTLCNDFSKKYNTGVLHNDDVKFGKDEKYKFENEYINFKKEKQNNIIKYNKKLLEELSDKNNIVLFDLPSTIHINNKEGEFNGDFYDGIKILIYTNLENMIKNIYTRRNNELRDKSHLMKFNKIYKVDDSTDSEIDIINRKKFKDYLHQVKFLFNDEHDLNYFANAMFKEMGINDDNDHKITPIHNYDYIITTYDLDERMKELHNIIDKNKNKKVGGNENNYYLKITIIIFIFIVIILILNYYVYIPIIFAFT